MGKYSIYAVAYGMDPSTGKLVTDMKFTTWRECLPYVNGVEGANFKGFLTDTEADTWLTRQCGMPRSKPSKSPLTRDPEYKQPVKRPVKQDAAPVLNRTKDEIKSEFAERCMRLGVDPNTVMYLLMTQWIELTDTMKVAQPIVEDKPENDDEPPWFD